MENMLEGDFVRHTSNITAKYSCRWPKGLVRHICVRHIFLYHSVALVFVDTMVCFSFFVVVFVFFFLSNF